MTSTANGSTARYISPDAIEKMSAQILNEAKLVREDVWTIDVHRLADVFGCEVQTVQFSPSTVSARITKRPADQSPYLIEVNASDSPVRRRFSIAHEIAHSLLHDDGYEDFEFIEHRQPLSAYEDPTRLYKEVQANMLAAALLMPQSEVCDHWRRFEDIDDLARDFEVSRQSAYFRLDNLGLLE